MRICLGRRSVHAVGWVVCKSVSHPCGQHGVRRDLHASQCFQAHHAHCANFVLEFTASVSIGRWGTGVWSKRVWSIRVWRIRVWSIRRRIWSILVWSICRRVWLGVH